MPEIARFYSIIIKMIFEDNKQHAKPHVHVYYNEFEALIGLDGEMLAGYLPPKQLKLVEAWIAIHENELYAAWNNAVQGKAFDKIEPLK